MSDLKTFTADKIIKRDAWGHIERGNLITETESVPAIKRVYSSAKWWAWPIAAFLAHNEKKSLQRLQSLAEQPHPATPKLLHSGRGFIVRSFIEATPLYKNPPKTPAYYKRAKYLLHKMRKLGVCNNDLAKEANWLVTADEYPCLIDFQLAVRSKKNRNYLRIFGYDDLRHLLKQKRKYCQHALTPCEQKILQQKTIINKVWMKTGRRMSRWYTRTVLGWERRRGPQDRGSKHE